MMNEEKEEMVNLIRISNEVHRFKCIRPCHVLLLGNELSCCESRMQDLQMEEMEKEEDTGGKKE